MADPIPDDLLHTLAAGDPIAMLLVATQGTPQGRELRAIAAELLAARQKIRADAEHLPTIESLTKDLHETEQELNAARAEVARLRAVAETARRDGQETSAGLHQVVDELRADLREGVEMLRAFRKDWLTIADWEPIWKRADELVEKHKENARG